MSKNESAEERVAREKFEAWLREIEAAAAEIVGGRRLIVQPGRALGSRPAAPLSALQDRESCVCTANGAGAYRCVVCCVRRKAAEPNEAARTFRLNRAEGEEWRMGRTLVDCSGAYDPDTMKP